MPKRNSKPAPVVGAPPLSHSWSSHYDVIAIGASAGGLNALIDVLRPIIAVKEAEHGEPILGAHVYVGPPDEHLLVGPGKVQLVHSQLVHFSRPSIDLLFESVAGMYGSRAIGVVLSGSNRDGATGIRAIREAGGTTIAQEPATAAFRQMPEAAIDTGCVDFVVPLEELGKMLNRLCNGEKIRP